MDKKKLTNTEKSILRQLETDARMAFAKIGKRTRMSQQRVSYTVNSLIKRGVIQSFYTLIDYSKFGALRFRVYFKVNYTNEERFKELIQNIKKEPSTSWIATCGGRYDIICTFLALNASSFNKTLKNIMRRFPDELQNYTILTTIVIRYFGRKYLFNDPSTTSKEIFLGGDRKTESFDDIDMKILDLIAENARISSVDIANKLSLTAKTIIKRIKKLIKREVILGFKPALNLEETDYMRSLLLIKCHNVVPEIEDKLIKYLKLHPNVVNVVKTLGEQDLEIQIETKSLRAYRKIVIDIRKRFAKLIREIDTVPIYEAYIKINYFPRFLME